jgi:metal-responsive CopG/Arc/MetJ family transcriptional regulator
MNVHVTLSLPPDKLREFDAWWKAEGFTSRSSAVSYLMSRVAKS